MSGTSLDAIDVAMVRIKGHGAEAEVKLEHFRSFPFPPKLRLAVRDLFDPKRARVDQICRYDFILGELFAAAVNRMLKETRTRASNVDLVAAAGQTLWHDPDPVIVLTDDVDWMDGPIAARSVLRLGAAASQE